jgi:hypothetical protein
MEARASSPVRSSLGLLEFVPRKISSTCTGEDARTSINRR